MAKSSPTDPDQEWQGKINAMINQNQELQRQYELKCIRANMIKKILAEKEQRLQNESRRLTDFQKRLNDLNRAVRMQSSRIQEDPFAAKYFELISAQIKNCDRVTKSNLTKANETIQSLRASTVKFEELHSKAEWLDQLKHEQAEIGALENDLVNCQEVLREKQQHYQKTMDHLKKCEEYSLNNWIVKLCKYAVDNQNLDKKIIRLKAINARLEQEKHNSIDTSFSTQVDAAEEQQPPSQIGSPLAKKQQVVAPIVQPESPQVVHHQLSEDYVPTPDSGIVEIAQTRTFAQHQARAFTEPELAPIYEDVEMQEENDEVASTSMNMSREFNYGQHDSPPRGDGFTFYNSNDQVPNQFMTPEQTAPPTPTINTSDLLARPESRLNMFDTINEGGGEISGFNFFDMSGNGDGKNESEAQTFGLFGGNSGDCGNSDSAFHMFSLFGANSEARANGNVSAQMFDLFGGDSDEPENGDSASQMFNLFGANSEERETGGNGNDLNFDFSFGMGGGGD